MEFSQLEKCPFCECETFFQKFQYRGSGLYFSNFDGTEANNTDMYDGVSGESSGRAYCANCMQYLGNINTGTLGKKATAALKEAEAALEAQKGGVANAHS